MYFNFATTGSSSGIKDFLSSGIFSSSEFKISPRVSSYWVSFAVDLPAVSSSLSFWASSSGISFAPQALLFLASLRLLAFVQLVFVLVFPRLPRGNDSSGSFAPVFYRRHQTGLVSVLTWRWEFYRLSRRCCRQGFTPSWSARFLELSWEWKLKSKFLTWVGYKKTTPCPRIFANELVFKDSARLPTTYW